MMSLDELSEQLGVSSESLDLLLTPKPKSKVKDKLLSFLSDSCYLSSPLWLSGSESESESEPDCIDSQESCTGSGFASLKSTPSSSSISFHSVSSSASSSISPHNSMQATLKQRSSLPSPASSLSPSLPSSSSSHSHPHPSPHHHLSLSMHHLQRASTTTAAMTTNLSHRQSLSAPLVPAADFFPTDNTRNTSPSQQLQIPSPCCSLTRHSSLNSCDLQCLVGLTEKTGRAHVSCPDFHLCSDMELGSASQDDNMGMETCDSSSSESHGGPNTGLNGAGTMYPGDHPMGGLNFRLPPFGEQQLPNLCPISPPHQPKNDLPTIWNPLPPISAAPALRGENFSSTGGKLQPMGGPLNRLQPSPPLSKKSHSTTRTPLQSLHNIPGILNSRQKNVGAGQKGKQVASPSALHFVRNSEHSQRE